MFRSLHLSTGLDEEGDEEARRWSQGTIRASPENSLPWNLIFTTTGNGGL